MARVCGKLEQATGWLEKQLRAGPARQKELKALAESAGHSWATVRRARSMLGIESRKVGAVWEWVLPGQGAHGAHCEGDEHLDAERHRSIRAGRAEREAREAKEHEGWLAYAWLRGEQVETPVGPGWICSLGEDTVEINLRGADDLDRVTFHAKDVKLITRAKR